MTVNIKERGSGFGSGVRVSPSLIPHRFALAQKMEELVLGPDGCARRQAGARCGSVEIQVTCLIEQATDANILARTWGGWDPWL